MKSGCLFGLLIFGCTLQLLGCKQAIPATEADSEIKRLVDQTIAANASLARGAQVSRTTFGVNAEWQITPKLATKEYLSFLRQNLGPAYQVVQQSDSTLHMRRVLPGDTYDLDIDATGSKPETLNVHFVAKPD